MSMLCGSAALGRLGFGRFGLGLLGRGLVDRRLRRIGALRETPVVVPEHLLVPLREAAFPGLLDLVAKTRGQIPELGRPLARGLELARTAGPLQERRLVRGTPAVSAVLSVSRTRTAPLAVAISAAFSALLQALNELVELGDRAPLRGLDFLSGLAAVKAAGG